MTQENEVRAEEILAALDEEQRQVALATRGPVCVIAGAGTGKTRAITHRIAYGAAIGTMNPQKTLALTFTARAAGEMRARLRSLGVPTVTARTFHSAALKQLLYFWPSVFGGRTPDLLTTKTTFITESIARAGLTSILPATSRELLRDVATEIEWAKVSMIPPEDYMESAKIRAERNRISAGQVAQVYAAYMSLLRQEHAIDFEDVLLLTTAMIEEEREVRERIHDQYRFFTVDEYQDVSPLQQRLLNAWLGSRQEICVVGDPAQTIYSFAGATPIFLNQFTQRFPEAEVIRLTSGYRSTPEIVFTANSVLRTGSMGQEIVAINAHGERPVLNNYKDEASEAAGVVQEIKRLATVGVPPQDIAVLARTNAQLKVLEKECIAQKIPYQVRNNDRFFERSDVRDFLKGVRQASVIPTEGVAWLDELRTLAQPFIASSVTDGVTALLHLARELDGDPTFKPKTLRTYLRELEDRSEQNNPPVMPVTTLATLHAAKGLEWPQVFLVGANEGILPTHENAVEEERRLFYVGITRAQNHLVVSYRQNPSRFLREAGLLTS
ncbi:MAG: AAA family ATPase [Actinobacteria bacterium]|uniref:DNA 3'-5' helicase n=1 Tax=freshwater metagenome TaxID=449393 RepID=A0A6J7U837_9ZZZZ|nr:ATP-dependent helicase [Actinomycetota bacterium]MSW47804.1 AAA family ATPase [Actinomycetota bacterium]MSX24976.1 AAA family ATPase [Actinomycetota bacterium]MSY46408.1 AAA family ATPase [Actinomycetota bacterium]MSY57344.1 AAA family ATPase [Actinomycetota bacterium]